MTNVWRLSCHFFNLFIFVLQHYYMIISPFQLALYVCEVNFR